MSEEMFEIKHEKIKQVPSRKLLFLATLILPIIPSVIAYFVADSAIKKGMLSDETIYYIANWIFGPILCWLWIMIIIPILFLIINFGIFIKFMEAVGKGLVSATFVPKYFPITIYPLGTFILNWFLWHSGLITVTTYDMSNPSFVEMFHGEFATDKILVCVSACLITLIAMEILGFIIRLIIRIKDYIYRRKNGIDQNQDVKQEDKEYV